jgi:D-alanyl-D-alanine carboxypeptidase/D-alanyl-D-alanine-endopeptidase (penicillin-binding protein 4)
VLTTRVVAEVPVVDGIVDGDVWLVGGGDPLLTTSGYAARFDDPGSYTDLGDLVKGLLGVGVREITGGIVGDESRYDAIRYLGTWPDRFKPGWSIQSGPLSALSVDDGFEKWDPVNTAPSLSVPAADPAANAASLLDDLLEVEGVVIRRRPDSGRSPAHPGMVTLVEVASPPVSLLVRQMLVHSDNTTAELLVKELGRTPAERGTTVAGLAVMLDTLERAGHDVDQVVPQDGSGLDPDNRVTCSLLVDVMEDDLHGALLVDSLPLAGESGTMKTRFVGTAGEGRVRAKTGTLRGVTSLAGVVDTPAGRRLAFAVISNGELPFEIRDLHEEVVLALLSYPAGPAVEALAPLPVVG